MTREWIAIAMAMGLAARVTAQPASPTPAEVEAVRDADVSIAYVLAPNRWMEFEIPPGRSLLRVVSNVNLSSKLAPLPRDEFPYVVKYELVDAKGSILMARSHQSRTRSTRHRDAAGQAAGGLDAPDSAGGTGGVAGAPPAARPALSAGSGQQAHTPAFYVGLPLVPADARTVLVRIDDLPAPVTRLRISIEPQSPHIADAVVRLYVQERVPAHRLRAAWSRMSPAERERLARQSVYSAELLSEEERRELLSERWAPLAPVGIEGESYTKRQLYLRRSTGQPVEDAPAPAGLPAGPEFSAMVPLPEQGAVIRLTCVPTGPEPGQHSVELLWYGHGATKRTSAKLDYPAAGLVVTRRFEGGTLEVRPTRRSVVRAFREEGAGDGEITPQPTYLRTARAGPGEPLEFEPFHAGSGELPWRLDVRMLLPAAGSVTPAAVRSELVDANGRVVAAAAASTSAVPSRLDRPFGLREEKRVSDAVKTFFRLPANVARVRVTADRPVLVTCYNRPADMRMRVAVPEDAFDFDSDRPEMRAWFPVAPRGLEELAASGRVQTLLLQPRPPPTPPAPDPALRSWEQFKPVGASRRRTFMSPRDPAEPLPPSASPSVGFPITPGVEATAVIAPFEGRRLVPPRLTYFGVKPGQSLRVSVDGRETLLARFGAASGQLALPGIPPGRHRIRVVTGPARMFLNHVEPGPGVTHVQRAADELPATGLTYEIQKHSPELEMFSVRYFAPAGRPERVQLDLTLTPLAARGAPGKNASWTFTRRTYDVRPGGGEAMPSMGFGDVRVDQGQWFVVPLMPDLPAGTYRMQVKPQGDPGGFLAVSAVRPEAPRSVRVYIERPAAARGAL